MQRRTPRLFVMVNASTGDKSSRNGSEFSDFANSGFYPNGEPVAWILLIITIFTLLANGIFALAYIRFPNLRTPFSIYLINLFIGDFVQALFVGPGTFVLYLTNGWPLGRTTCSLYLYVWWTASGFLFSMHLTISLNRLWAVTFPVHYRTFHSKNVAVAICIGVWVYSHAWTLPAVISDSLYYRMDSKEDCALNYEAQPRWSVWSNIIAYDLPEVLIVILYPVTVYKIWKQRSRKPTVVPDVRRPTVHVIASEAHHFHSSAIRAENSESFFTRNSPPIGPTTQNGSNGKTKERQRSHFRVLHLLVLGAVICWTPLNVYYTLAGFMDYSNFQFLSVANVLFYANSLINPICYPLASQEWRSAVKQVLHMQ